MLTDVSDTNYIKSKILGETSGKVKNNLIFRPPNNQTRSLSIIVVVSFIIALVGGAYGHALHKGEIDSEKFTVSQALAHGNKEIMVTLFIVSFLSAVMVNYIRGGEKYFLIFRISCLILIYAMMISLIWIPLKKIERFISSWQVLFLHLLQFIF